MNGEFQVGVLACKDAPTAVRLYGTHAPRILLLLLLSPILLIQYKHLQYSKVADQF